MQNPESFMQIATILFPVHRGEHRLGDWKVISRIDGQRVKLNEKRIDVERVAFHHQAG